MPPKVSVIVPVYNGESTLPLCLQPLRESDYPNLEILVVDDHSTDSSARIAREFGAHVYVNEGPRGPAAARNLGAKQALGDILLFIDADVVPQNTTVSKVVSYFENNAGLSALFGSYDTEPGAPNFLSQYKNLFHHFVHQNSSEDATTFWAGCGAIKRNTFHALGGFDSQLYSKPSIEDIELGLRLKKNGGSILLAKDIQVKHLKRWTWRSLLQADIFYRAVPWSRLILTSKFLPSDLNLHTSQRISAFLTGIVFLTIAWLIVFPGLAPVFTGTSAGAFIVILNRKFYAFYLRQKGLFFAILTFPCHLLYYFYSSLTFVICWLDFQLRPKKSPDALRPHVVE